MFLSILKKFNKHYPLTGPVYSIITANSHDANIAHMPGTHFTSGWIDGPCAQVTKAWFLTNSHFTTGNISIIYTYNKKNFK